MTDTPKRIWARDLDGTGSLHICSKEDDGAISHIPEALVTDLVRAGYLAGLEAAANMLEPSNPRDDWTLYAHDCHAHAKTVRDLAIAESPTSEAIAAIVARVTNGKS